VNNRNVGLKYDILLVGRTQNITIRKKVLRNIFRPEGKEGSNIGRDVYRPSRIVMIAKSGNFQWAGYDYRIEKAKDK
jgi:hypothetical protein